MPVLEKFWDLEAPGGAREMSAYSVDVDEAIGNGRGRYTRKQPFDAEPANDAREIPQLEFFTKGPSDVSNRNPARPEPIRSPRRRRVRG